MAVEFAPIEELDFFGLTRLQSRWDTRYPDLQSVPGAPPTPLHSEGEMTFQITNGEPPRRIWAAGRGDGRLVQTQNDRLILNWRKQFSSEPYPTYAVLAEEFEDLWRSFGTYLQEVDLPPLRPTLMEFTYVNGVSLDAAQSYQDVMSLVGTPKNELPGYELFTRFQFIREIRQADGHPFDGQIFIQGEPQEYNGARHLFFTVTARLAFHEGADPLDGLAKARGLASHTFARIITPQTQERWGKEP